MNNEQNNSIFGGINPIPPVGLNSVSNGGQSSISNIPGANLTPVGGADNVQPVSTLTDTNNKNLSSQSPISIMPIPEIGENNNIPNMNESNNMVSSSLSTNNQEVLSIKSNSVNSSNLTTTPKLKPEISSPFDIGLGNSAVTSNLTENLNQTLTNNDSNSLIGTAEPPTPVVSNKETNLTMTNNNTTSSNNAPIANNNNIPLTNSPTMNVPNSDKNIVTVGKYLGNLILFCIPVVGFIMLIIKAFADKKDKNITNLARSYLLFEVIVFVFVIVISIVSVLLSTNVTPKIGNSNSSYYDYDYNFE